MSYTKVFIHFIWSTKNRFPFLNSFELRTKVWRHIKENAAKHGIHVDTVNGHKDHCHCLISLSKGETMTKLMQLIKGESSHWINENQLCERKFEWQDEYYALSISHSALDTVRKYIYNQESHHKENNFNEEYDVLKKNVFAECAEMINN